jgi:SAM-dependent methyltransferase
LALAYRTEENNPLLLALCQDTPVCAGLNLDVDERDEMLGFFLDTTGRDRDRSITMYFQSGLLLWESLRTVLAWRYGPLREARRIGKLLDFASGYGRVSRFVLSELPPERVWVADIYAEAVAFQVERFGVHGLVSTADPADFSCDERFDVILVSSLFTHLPEATFTGWLAKLWSLLAPGGLLAFSVHDPGLLWPPRELPPGGLLFEPVSESATLDKGQYGSSWVSEDFVRRTLADLAPRASVHRVPRGLVNFQDLWVVIDEPGVDFSGLGLRAGPEVFLDHCSFAPPDRLRLSGWVADRVLRRPVQEVQALVGDAVVGRTRAFSAREDAAHLYPGSPLIPQGWQLEIELPPGTVRATAVLEIRAVDAAGETTRLYGATVDAALLRSTRLDLLATGVELHRTRTEGAARLAQAQAEAAAEKSALEARIAAMQASFFWKLRNRWFALKRFLRLTDEP